MRTDAKRLQQVLRNLLSNAFKFTETGNVALTIAPADGSPLRAGSQWVSFSVSDTGIGIPEEKQRIIFEAFQQADGTTSRKYGGTGLGLSISREIARLLGGEITLHSIPGQGSTFTLYLPIEPVIQVSPRALSEATSSGLGRTGTAPASVPVTLSASADDRHILQPGDTTVLIVEDDAMFASVLLELAHDKGFKGLIAADGATALALAQRYRPQAITLDIGLPDMDGWALLDLFKRDPRTRHVPVHVISVDEQRKRGLRAGAFDFLEKPVDRDAIMDALDRTRDFVNRPFRNLLIVEDDEGQRTSIAALIGNGDVHVRSVASAEEALAALNQEEFDCAVIDLGLPDRPGIDLIEDIRQRQDGRPLPIVVYSGRDLLPEDLDRLDRLGTTFIAKDNGSSEKLLSETALFLHRAMAAIPPEQQTVVHAQSGDAFRGKKVLIVDDDLRNIFSLTSALEQHGMEVIFAENGRDGIDLLKNTGDVDAMLVDIMMPGMDGYETMREIRKDPAFAHLPIIAVTAKAMKGDREKCLEEGASDYIAKPLDLDQLLAVMRVQLGAPARGRMAARSEPFNEARRRRGYDADTDEPGSGGADPRQDSDGGRRPAQSPGPRTAPAGPRVRAGVGAFGRGGAQASPARRFCRNPARRADADHGRLRGGEPDPQPLPLVACADHLSNGLQQGRSSRLPRLHGRRGRLCVQADRADHPAVQGGRLRRALPQNGGDPAPVRAGAQSAPGEHSRPQRETRGRTGLAAGAGSAGCDPALAAGGLDLAAPGGPVPPVFVSDNVERITGFPAERFTSDPGFGASRLHPEDIDQVFRALAGALEAGHYSCEYRWQCADGTYRHFLDQGVLAPTVDGEQREIFGTMFDVTERRLLEERLMHGSKLEAIGQLTGGIAHDFNNMLSVVMGSLDLLRNTLGDNALAHKRVRMALEGAQRCADLTNRLLSFARRQPLRASVVDLEAFGRDLVEILRRTLGDNIDLRLEAAEGLWPVQADPSQLEAALVNLAVNSRDAMPDGGRITIEMRNVAGGEVGMPAGLDGDAVLIRVADTGFGMTPEVRDRVFEPFFTTKEMGRGTGLGLSMTYGFVKQSGGEIEIRSAPAQGTTVSLFLPRIRNDTDSLLTADTPQGAPEGNGEIILVVEDDEEVRNVVLSTLQMLGYARWPRRTARRR
jgi:PAS domain S-box-containing protein